jgi:hypothetical protein
MPAFRLHYTDRLSPSAALFAFDRRARTFTFDELCALLESAPAEPAVMGPVGLYVSGVVSVSVEDGEGRDVSMFGICHGVRPAAAREDMVVWLRDSASFYASDSREGRRWDAALEAAGVDPGGVARLAA